MDEIALEIEVPFLHGIPAIDVAVIGGRMVCLPGEVSRYVAIQDNPVSDGGLNREKSAEVIVLGRCASRGTRGRAEQQYDSLNETKAVS